MRRFATWATRLIPGWGHKQVQTVDNRQLAKHHEILSPRASKEEVLIMDLKGAKVRGGPAAFLLATYWRHRAG
jgi:hypothetical protein